MDFSWNKTQLALKEKVIQFAQTLNDNLVERDKQGLFSRDQWQKCADFGILKLLMPSAYGGDNHDLLTTVLAMEAFGYGCRDNGLVLALNEHIWCIQQPFLIFASEEQKQKYLPALCSGELICTQAISEESAGSDALNMQTTAQKVTGGYLLNGKKSYISLAPVADMSLVFAKTNPQAAQWGISLFLVENNATGCTPIPRDKMGTRTNPLGDLVFEDCFVPEANRIGREGIGVSVFSQTMDWERSFILASYVGAMAYQLEQSVHYAKNRQQYGQAIGNYQSVSNRLADMKSRLEIARLLLYKQAWQKQNQKLNLMDAAITNLHISESFLQSSLDAVRIHGGRGYLSEFGIERDLRDAVGSVIYAGTSDIQRNIIAKLLGKQIKS
jgi:alkylation response protein AidB-like acyl-CoA dehydrogenase